MNDGDNDPSRATVAWNTAKSRFSQIEAKVAQAAMQGQEITSEMKSEYDDAQHQVDETWKAVKAEMDETQKWINEKYGDKPYH